MPEVQTAEAPAQPRDTLSHASTPLGHALGPLEGSTGARTSDGVQSSPVSTSGGRTYTVDAGSRSEPGSVGLHAHQHALDVRLAGGAGGSERTPPRSPAVMVGLERPTIQHSMYGAAAAGAEVERLKAELQQMQVRLAASDAECRALQHANRAQYDDLQRARGSAVALRGMLQEEVRQREEFASECRRLQRELDLASSGINQSQRALRNAAEVVAKLEDEVEQLRASRNAMHLELQNANARVARVQNDARQHAERNAELGTQLHGVITTLRQLEGEHTRLADGYAATQVELQARVAEARAAQGEAAELAADRARMVAQMQGMRAELERLKERHPHGAPHDASAEVAMLRAELAANDSVLAEAEAALVALIAEKDDLQQQLNAARAAERLASEEAEAMRARVASLQGPSPGLASPARPLEDLVLASMSGAPSEGARDLFRTPAVTTSVSVAFGSPDLEPMGVAAAASTVSPSATGGRQRYPTSPGTSGSSASPQSTYQLEAWIGQSEPQSCDRGPAESAANSRADGPSAPGGTNATSSPPAADGRGSVLLGNAHHASAASTPGTNWQRPPAVDVSASTVVIRRSSATNESSAAAELDSRHAPAPREYRRSVRSATGEGSEADAQARTPSERAARTGGPRPATASGDLEGSFTTPRSADRPSTTAKLLLAWAASGSGAGAGTPRSPLNRRPGHSGSQLRESLERLLSEVTQRPIAPSPTSSTRPQSVTARPPAPTVATSERAAASAAKEHETPDSAKPPPAAPSGAQPIVAQPTLPYPSVSGPLLPPSRDEVVHASRAPSATMASASGTSVSSNRSSVEAPVAPAPTSAHPRSMGSGGSPLPQLPAVSSLPVAEAGGADAAVGSAYRATASISSRVILLSGASAGAPGPAAGADGAARPAGGGGGGGGVGNIMISPRMTLESMVLGRAVRQVTGALSVPLRPSASRSSSGGAADAASAQALADADAATSEELRPVANAVPSTRDQSPAPLRPSALQQSPSPLPRSLSRGQVPAPPPLPVLPQPQAPPQPLVPLQPSAAQQSPASLQQPSAPVSDSVLQQPPVPVQPLAPQQLSAPTQPATPMQLLAKQLEPLPEPREPSPVASPAATPSPRSTGDGELQTTPSLPQVPSAPALPPTPESPRHEEEPLDPSPQPQRRPSKPPPLLTVTEPNEADHSRDMEPAGRDGPETLPGDEHSCSPQYSPTAHVHHVRLPSPAVSEASLSLSQLARRISGEAPVPASIASAMGSFSERSTSSGSALPPRPSLQPHLSAQRPSAAFLAASAAAAAAVAAAAPEERSGAWELASAGSGVTLQSRPTLSPHPSIHRPSGSLQSAASVSAASALEERSSALDQYPGGNPGSAPHSRPSLSPSPSVQRPSAAFLAAAAAAAAAAATATPEGRREAWDHSEASGSPGTAASTRPSLSSHSSLQGSPATLPSQPPAAASVAPPVTEEQSSAGRRPSDSPLGPSSVLLPRPSAQLQRPSATALGVPPAVAEVPAATPHEAGGVLDRSAGTVSVGSALQPRPSLSSQPPLQRPSASLLAASAALAAAAAPAGASGVRSGAGDQSAASAQSDASLQPSVSLSPRPSLQRPPDAPPTASAAAIAVQEQFHEERGPAWDQSHVSPPSGNALSPRPSLPLDPPAAHRLPAAHALTPDSIVEDHGPGGWGPGDASAGSGSPLSPHPSHSPQLPSRQPLWAAEPPPRAPPAAATPAVEPNGLRSRGEEFYGSAVSPSLSSSYQFHSQQPQAATPGTAYGTYQASAPAMEDRTKGRSQGETYGRPDSTLLQRPSYPSELPAQRPSVYEPESYAPGAAYAGREDYRVAGMTGAIMQQQTSSMGPAGYHTPYQERRYEEPRYGGSSVNREWGAAKQETYVDDDDGGSELARRLRAMDEALRGIGAW